MLIGLSHPGAPREGILEKKGSTYFHKKEAAQTDGHYPYFWWAVWRIERVKIREKCPARSLPGTCKFSVSGNY